VSDSYDLLFAIGLPIIGAIQAAFLLQEFKQGKARLSPMHIFEKSRSPKAFAFTLAGNIILVGLLLVTGMYYISKVVA